MLCRGEDYAHQQPSLTNKKLRRLELTAGAPKYAKTARGTCSTNAAIRTAERQLAEQAEASYRRMLKDRQAAAPARKVGASATPERA
jgi:hypothetical protein